MQFTVLIAEDEPLIAMDLTMQVEDLDHQVMGPCKRVADLRRMLCSELPDCAVLDVRLDDGEVFEVADRLAAHNIPFLFHSGHANGWELKSRYPDAVICPKPSSPSNLERHLKMLFEKVENTQPRTPA